MLKNKIIRYINYTKKLAAKKNLAFLRRWLESPCVLRLNRFYVAKGVAIALFCLFIPLPFHSVIAVFVAYFCSANVPIAFILVFLINPIIMTPLYFCAYMLGKFLLRLWPWQGEFAQAYQQPILDGSSHVDQHLDGRIHAEQHLESSVHAEQHMESILNMHSMFDVREVYQLLYSSFKPLLLGCLILGVVFSTLGYFTVIIWWRRSTLRAWRNRHKKLQKPKKPKKFANLRKYLSKSNLRKYLSKSNLRKYLSKSNLRKYLSKSNLRK